MWVLCSSHCQGVLVVFQAIVGFVTNSRVRVFLAHTRHETATLNHEIVNDAVKYGAVVMALVHVRQEVLCAQRRIVLV